MNYDIPPIDCHIAERVFHNMDPSFAGTIKGRVFSLALYAGEMPAFNVLTHDGALFSYVHPALCHVGAQAKRDIDGHRWAYHNCPDGPAQIIPHAALRGKVAFCEKTAESLCWIDAEYILTIDWYRDNLLLHLVVDTEGHFFFVPSHKINFNGTHRLPDYKKLKQTWRVP